MDAIVLAGGALSPDDPLYPYTQGRPKAMLVLAGRPMLLWVLAALAGARQIDQICVVGLAEGPTQVGGKAVAYLPDQGGIVSNVQAGLAWQATQGRAGYALVCSADIPLLTGAMVDDFIDRVAPRAGVLSYPFITQADTEARFPGSRRTYTRLGALTVTGGNVALVHTDVAHTNQALWEAITAARKHPWRIARLIGWRVLLKLLLRRLTLAEIEALATRILGRPAYTLLLPYPEIGMDADKPHQVELLRAELERRAPAGAPPASPAGG